MTMPDVKTSVNLVLFGLFIALFTIYKFVAWVLQETVVRLYLFITK